MGLFNLFRKKKSELVHQEAVSPASTAPVPARVDFTCEITPEEKELTAVVASAIAAGSYPDSSFKIKNIQGINTDKETAAAIVSAVMAGNQPNSTFRLVSITEMKKE